MTTPAVNVDIIKRKTVRVCTTPNSNTVPITCSVASTTFPFYWEKKVRPASGASPIVSGFRPCRQWTHFGHNWSYSGGTAKVVRQFSGYQQIAEYPDGNFWGQFSPPVIGAFPNGVVNRAEQKALLKLKNQTFNLGQFAAEWRQTSGMLAGAALTIARQVRNFRKKFPKDWRKVKRYQGLGGCPRHNWHLIPSGWLQLQYGWIPLLSDINGALQHLQKDRLPQVHVKGYAEDVSETSYQVTGASDSRNSLKLSYDVKTQCWVSLWYQLTDPGLAELSSLGLINPAEIVWEILPYSFVIDWFLPVGNWLSSLTADRGFSFLGGSLSKLSTVKDVRTSDVEWFKQGNVTTSGSTPEIVGEAFRFDRLCYSSSPVPGLYLKNPLSATHIANAMSLLVLAFGGNRRNRR